jgi:3-oxoacyl-(acyl-carrier-protein) synthase III
MDSRPRAGVRVSGVGVEIPPHVVTSTEVEERARIDRFGLEPGWLERLTGVRERRWADPAIPSSELAARAGRKALANAGLEPEQVDTVLFCGIVRDTLEPATCNAVAEAVGARRARVMDLSNACNGIIDGIDVADALIRTGKARRVLVTTGERTSIATDMNARNHEELMRTVASLTLGDGGGAFVLEPSEDPGRGLCARYYASDPTQWRHAIALRLRPSTQACEICGSLLDRFFHCEGHKLFSAVFPLFVGGIGPLMEQTGWTFDDLDLVFLHEVSKRFIESAIPLLGPAAGAAQKLWSTVERFGNTSTLTLPLQMAEAQAAGVLVPGSKLVAVGVSSGVSVGAVAMVW